jgi:hypothetical protein
LSAIHENPIEEEKESLSYYGTIPIRSQMRKEKDAYDFSMGGSIATKDDLIVMKHVLAQSKTSTAARETIASCTSFLKSSYASQKSGNSNDA